ncbi:conserved hypothetical protein, partial [Ricinus communis]
MRAAVAGGVELARRPYRHLAGAVRRQAHGGPGRGRRARRRPVDGVAAGQPDRRDALSGVLGDGPSATADAGDLDPVADDRRERQCDGHAGRRIGQVARVRLRLNGRTGDVQPARVRRRRAAEIGRGGDFAGVEHAIAIGIAAGLHTLAAIGAVRADRLRSERHQRIEARGPGGAMADVGHAAGLVRVEHPVAVDVLPGQHRRAALRAVRAGGLGAHAHQQGPAVAARRTVHTVADVL